MAFPAVVQAIDLPILRALYAGSWSTPWKETAFAVTWLGSGWMMLGLVPAIFSRRWRDRALVLIVTLGTTSAVVAMLKVLAGRVRPCNALDWACALPIAFPSDYSFPSGHAAGSFAFACFVLKLRPKIGVWLLGLAASIAATRVMLGVHYPSDVFVGAILGSAIGWVGAKRAERRVSAAVRRLPHADPESVGQ